MAKTALISLSKPLIDEVQTHLKRLIADNPRKEILSDSIDHYCAMIHVESQESGITLINQLAPEHLELMIKDAGTVVKQIDNAGAIFLGNYTPNALGDYWAGPNHTLPTAGAARFSSPLNVMDFMKFSSVTGYSEAALGKISEQVSLLADGEQLYSHARSIDVRCK